MTAIPATPLSPAQRALVAANLGLASYVARKYAVAFCAAHGHTRHYHTYQEQYFRELIDACWVGLCLAARRYDPERGAKFSTVAVFWIRSQAFRAAQDAELRSGTNKTTRRERLKLFSELAGSGLHHGDSDTFDVWDSRSADDDPPDPEPSAELLALLHLVLKPRQVEFVRDHVLRGLTLQEIGDKHGISRERVRQVVERALGVLRESRRRWSGCWSGGWSGGDGWRALGWGC